MKIGLNQVLIRLGGGVAGYCGINQQWKKVILTLKDVSACKINMYII